jgi:hypothetical protein
MSLCTRARTHMQMILCLFTVFSLKVRCGFHMHEACIDINMIFFGMENKVT